MVNAEGVDAYIVNAMNTLINADCFVAAVRLARGNAPRLGLREAKDLADAIQDQIKGVTVNYTVEQDLNLTSL